MPGNGPGLLHQGQLAGGNGESMIHLGDITAISGYTVPPVDAVIGGSPCQDYAEERVIPK